LFYFFSFPTQNVALGSRIRNNGRFGLKLARRNIGLLKIRAEATSSRTRAVATDRPTAPPALAKLLQIIRSSGKSLNKSKTMPEIDLPVSPLALIALTSAVSFICSIDRAAMSVAILPMSQTFDWDDGVKGAISSAFFAGYMITNLSGGYLATRFSPKQVLAGGVVLWSLFTMFTPAAAASQSLPELLAVRSMMGVGEGVSYPSIQNLVRSHVPDHARSRALSFIYSGHQMGTIMSYIASPILIAHLGWESVFFVFGSLGFVWLVTWSPLIAAEKEEQQRLRDAATATPPAAPLRIQDVPWMEFAQSKPFWAIVAAQVTVGIGSCLSFSWLPTYYSEVFKVDIAHSAAFCLVPFIATVFATNAAGHVADRLINNNILTKTQTRKLMQSVASLGPAACLLRLAFTHEAAGDDPAGNGLADAVVMVTAWLALGGFSAAGYGSNHQDISSKWAGIMFGLSNGLASIAGSASIYATGMVLHQTHDWSLIFESAAVMYIIGAGVYLKWGSAEQYFE
jgi:ACS family sodium-dependent inorganic phosphate cotransporter